MVFVKVRETYDLHTTRNKMTVIGIHTPKPDIIKRNYPGLLMQCKAYRPVSCDVRIACASVLPLDPKGVGLTEGDVAPEDVFNPILYKAMSNFGMSQLEARINYLSNTTSLGADVRGSTADVDVNSVTSQSDEFNIYYGLLSETHNWKHAHPQQGLSMKGLKPLVWEMVYNAGDNDVNINGSANSTNVPGVQQSGLTDNWPIKSIRGGPRKMPFINCTAYSVSTSEGSSTRYADVGFPYADANITNCSVDVPYLNVVCGAVICPPSRLHEFFYRMVVEWTLEFSTIRSVIDLTDWNGMASVGNLQHYQNYNYSATKKALTGDEETILDSDACMVSANVDIEKVM